MSTPAQHLPAHGGQIEDFFVYAPEPVLASAGKTATVHLILDQDSDFSVQKLTGFVTDQGVPPVVQVNALVLIQWRAGGSGRDIFSNPIPFAALFGSGELPFILPTPRLLRAGTTITIDVSNIGSTDYKVYPCFVGKKVFTL